LRLEKRATKTQGKVKTLSGHQWVGSGGGSSMTERRKKTALIEDQDGSGRKMKGTQTTAEEFDRKEIKKEGGLEKELNSY